MYEDFYGLVERPFELTANPRFLFLTSGHREALSNLTYGLTAHKGITLLLGEAGTGKTTLVRAAMGQQKGLNTRIAYLSNPTLTRNEFLEFLTDEFELPPEAAGSKVRFLNALTASVTKRRLAGGFSALVVDEAQSLPHELLEEVRLLSNLELPSEKLVPIILAGQPELGDKLDSQELVQLRQRVRLRFHLTALGKEDMEHYIRHRLRVAGAGDREIFEPDTFPLVFRYAGGIPRLVNTLCDTAMIAAFASERRSVGVEEIKSAVTELQWVEYTPPTSSQRIIEDTGLHHTAAGAKLVLSYKGLALRECPLLLGRIFIGRTPDNELHVDSKYVSRHHAQVITTTEGSWVEDLNSTNGMFVRGKRVRRHKLQEGDVIQLGIHEISYHRVEPVGVATQVLPPDALEAAADSEADEESDLEADPESAPAEGDDAA